jgi:acyl CoA:acetate/3-ketoacid CoA transferase beta subunit
MATEPTRADYCAIAIAECFRGDGEIMANAIGNMQSVGGRLARASFEPDLVMTDGVASLLANDLAVGAGPDAEKVVEGYLPYRTMFEVLWNGRRHVMMGASQMDAFGNQNFSAIGDPKHPTVQLLGMRGAPGNTINHTTSYWIPKHNSRVFVEKVDVVSGMGYTEAAKLGDQSRRFHNLRRVVTNLGSFDFETADHRMRIHSLHPGVTADEVVEATGFDIVVPEDIPETRMPTTEEMDLLNNVIDPRGFRHSEVPSE